MPTPRANRRQVCFVTGTRAEFGLMRSTLRALQAHPGVRLQLIVTGMHLHAAHGRSIDTVLDEGWRPDAVVPWSAGHGPVAVADQTGVAMSRLARELGRLKTDVVLVVGDRVEAFAAAAAGHLARRVVAHVHGGDRAEGQIDDSLRHAITKLAHVHFPATPASARRLQRLGEDPWRIHRVGSPGLDGLREHAAGPDRLYERFPRLARRRFALIALHPVEADPALEERHAELVLSAVLAARVEQTVVIYPNNDPGSRGIIRCWRRREGELTERVKDLPRGLFLGLLRDAAVLVGNSSSGIIEAASFGTPVVDIGPRQAGRERSGNVVGVTYDAGSIRDAVARAWNNGRPTRWRGRNVYGGAGAGARIAGLLGTIPLDERLRRKLIVY